MKNLFIAFLLASTALAGVFIAGRDDETGLALDNAALSQETHAADVLGGASPLFQAVTPKQASSETAQTAPPQEAGEKVSDKPIPQVDESALRYFASRGDKVRLQTEITRLKALYPDWNPPENPLAPIPVRDAKLDLLWKFYADGQYAELRKAIATRKIQDPEWVVPADLLKKLDLAEARQRLINASDNKQYDMVVSLAAKSPQLLTCNEIDVLWRLSEAFAQLDKTDRARDGYLYILKNCTVPAERLVTAQKALEILPYSDAQAILAQQKIGPDGKGEFTTLNEDVSRRFVALAAQTPEMKIDKSYLSMLETLAQADGSATDAETLGWYYLRRNDMKSAEKWFLLAKEKDDSVTVSQGLALVLNGRGDYAQAEDTMYPWRDQSSEATAVYFAATANLLASDPPTRMPAIIAQDVITRIAAATIEAKNVNTAQQLGWYARAVGQQTTAIQWFQTALSWDNADEPSAYGLAVSFYTVGDNVGLENVKKTWSAHSQRIADVGTERDKYSRTPGLAPLTIQDPAQRMQPVQPANQTDVAAQRRTGSANTGKAPMANTRNCRKTLEGAMPTGGGAVAHGWCLMDQNRPIEAIKSFESALATGSAHERSEAAYGQSLAYLRVGLVDNAAASAIKAPMSPARQKELRVSILSDRAVAAFQGGQFRDTLFLLEQRAQIAPPRKDLMALQAASYLKLRRYDDARVLYQALAASGDREGIRGMAAIRELQRPH